MSKDKVIQAEPNVKADSYSVKTTTDITQRIQELTKRTGMSHKDLFAAMVTKYYAEQEAGSDIDQSDDMQQIRYHLSRVENIFLASLQKVKDIKDSYVSELETKTAQHKEVMEDLNNERLSLKKELEELTKENKQVKNEYKNISAKNEELEEQNRSNRMTIELLSNKIKELEAALTEVSSIKEELNNLKDDKTRLEQEIESLQEEISSNLQTISQLEDQLRKAEEEYNSKLLETKQAYEIEENRLKLSFDKDIKQLKDIHKLEIDKLKIECERKVLENIQNVKNQCNEKIEKLLEKNDQLVAKNQLLTEQLFSIEKNKQENDRAKS